MYMFFYSFRLHIYNSCGKTASSYAIFLAEFCSEAENCIHAAGHIKSSRKKTFLNKKNKSYIMQQINPEEKVI